MFGQIVFLSLVTAQSLEVEVAEDLKAFPSMEVIEEQINHWNRHLYWLGTMKGGATFRDQYTAWQQETNMIMVAWEQLRAARGGGGGLAGWATNKETAMVNLKKIIGEANYDIGRMPMISTTLYLEERPMIQRPPPPRGMAPQAMPQPKQVGVQ